MSAYVPTSHQSGVSFNGYAIGYLTGWRFSAGVAQFHDTTSVNSPVIGEGLDARIVRQMDCISIEPGGVDVNLYGCPDFLPAEVGTRGTLAVTFSGVTWSAEAYLETFEVAASVGEMLAGTARFRFTNLEIGSS